VDSISDILEQIKTYAPDASLEPVMESYLLAAKAHAGQHRKSGEAYLTHPLAVAMILAQWQMDVDTISTALLHDALEDNPMSKQELAAEVGPLIADLVDGVTKIGKLRFRSKEELQAENFRKMMLAMSKDLRVILVKLADRLHNMRTLEHHRQEKQVSISQETLDIFVPIANRLGLDGLKCEFEDLCFRYLNPEAFAQIDIFLRRTQSDRMDFTKRVAKMLAEQLQADGHTCEVTGRAKHRYSIFKKMTRRNIRVDEVPDLLAFRVLASDVGECYAVLGLIHGQFAPVPERIKDYIARPKPNGYQSLHTTVIGLDEKRIEIQIRTAEMHRIAEEGIAAHWQYKEGHLAISPDDVARLGKIRDLFEAVRDAEDATEFMETIKVEFYADEVFAFTPRGDIKRFPRGATALDFAFAIHTDVGERCTGAKVSGRLVPLRYELQSGDTLEVLTSSHQRPSRDWLEIARTGRAVQKIRRYLREEQREKGIRLGQELLEAELKRFGSGLQKAKHEGFLKAVLDKRNYRDVEHLFYDVAVGNVSMASVVRYLLPDGVYTVPGQSNQTPLASLFGRFRSRAESPVLITGEDGVLVQYGGCCNPLPGESVIGFITRGRGITVHRKDCSQLKNMPRERQILVEWDKNVEAHHSGEIRIVCNDRPGLLANITKICEKAGVNINRVEASPMNADLSICTLEISVRDVGELTSLIKNIEKVKGVQTVDRMTG